VVHHQPCGSVYSPVEAAHVPPIIGRWKSRDFACETITLLYLPLAERQAFLFEHPYANGTFILPIYLT
jgi:hypothetical protein